MTPLSQHLEIFPMTETRKPKFWGEPDDELLTCYEMNECIGIKEIELND